MKFKYDPNLYDFTDGRYIATFLNVVDFDTSKLPPSPNNPGGPAVQWSFRIENGPDVGKIASTLTSPYPTPKNAMMRMASGLIRRPLAEDEEIDTDKYKGRYYAVSIIDGKLSNKFAPQYLGADMQTALRTFDPDATVTEAEAKSEADKAF